MTKENGREIGREKASFIQSGDGDLSHVHRVLSPPVSGLLLGLVGKDSWKTKAVNDEVGSLGEERNSALLFAVNRREKGGGGSIKQERIVLGRIGLAREDGNPS